MAGFDITEGSSTRAVVFDLGITTTGAGTWLNTDTSYDVAIDSMPFIYAINDQNPYIRQTAAFRKEQFDNQAEPGEQSLTGWWIRSQSSFHNGAGIQYYDPTGGESGFQYRFNTSRGVDVWTKGQVTLLQQTYQHHVVTQPIATSGKVMQTMRPIKWSGTNGVLFHDGYDVDKLYQTDTLIPGVVHFIDYNAGADDKVYAICDDGTTAYWVTNDTGPSGKLEVNKKALTGTSSTAATVMFTQAGLTVTNAVMDYVKERIVMAVNNKVYEFGPGASSLPTAVYTHGDSSHIFTSITSSGSAIYLSGFSGVQSNIYKFTLNTSGAMPTLTSAITAAEMPAGEVIHKIKCYLGYMLIGTSKGVRVAAIGDDGSINYGPLLFESTQPVYDFSCRDHYAWCASGHTDGYTGLVRIDLSNQIDVLRFAYANDIGIPSTWTLTNVVTSVSHLGDSADIMFTQAPPPPQVAVTNATKTGDPLFPQAIITTSTAHGLVQGNRAYVVGTGNDSLDGGPYYVLEVISSTQFRVGNTYGRTFTFADGAYTGYAGAAGYVWCVYSANTATDGSGTVLGGLTLVPSGYIQTGKIRYNTLEPKNFKRLIAKCNVDYGSLQLNTVDATGTVANVITYSDSTAPQEVTTTSPSTPQEYLSYKFVLNRDSATADRGKGPVFNAYQAKSTIATQRQRVVRFPVFVYDTETDKYNVTIGYEGRAWDRLQALEAIESNGDIVTWQDLTTGEQRPVAIEQVTFTRMTPPDKSFSGYGGIATITIRTVE